MAKLTLKIAGLATLLLTASCTTTGEQARADAFERCNEIADRGVRQTCISQAIVEAQEARNAEVAREADEAAQRERDAAVNQAYGAPDSATREN